MKNLIIFSLIIISLCHIKTFAQSDVQSIDVLMQKGQYSQALILLEKLNIGDSTQLEILQKQALCNFKLGRLSQSKKLYYSALQKNLISSEILLQIATKGRRKTIIRRFSNHTKN